MKKLWKVVLGMIVALLVTGCDLLNVDVETTFDATLDVVVNDPGAKMAPAGHHFMATKMIDPQDNQDVQDYADDIRSVMVDGVFADVLNVSTDEVTIYADALFKIYNSSDTAVFPVPTDWSITDETNLNLTDHGGFYDDLSDILINFDEVFYVVIDGYSSKNNVEFTVKLSMDCTVTGSPI
jgi:hypothetical protein